MKARIIVITLVVLVGVGLGAHAAPAQAAEEAVISADDASKLKQGLDALKWLLDEVGRRLEIAEPPIEAKAETNAALEGIKTNLGKIDAMLTARTLALREKSGGQKVAQLSLAITQEETGGAITQKEAGGDETIGAFQTPAIPEYDYKQAAAVGLNFDYNKLIWPVLISIVIVMLTAVWLSRMKEKTEGITVSAAIATPVTTVPPAIPETSPIHPAPLELMSVPTEQNQEHPLY